jgi:hypothetical protein
VPRREATNSADSALGLGYDQSLLSDICLNWNDVFFKRLRPDCRIVIVKNKSGRVRRITLTLGASVSRAKITRGVVRRLVVFMRILYGPLPGPLCAMGRNQDPFTSEHIKTPMRRVCERQHSQANA